MYMFTVVVPTAGATGAHCFQKLVNIFFPLCGLSLHFSVFVVDICLLVCFVFVVQKNLHFMGHHLLVWGIVSFSGGV